jgi:hypothetical protein
MSPLSYHNKPGVSDRYFLIHLKKIPLVRAGISTSDRIFESDYDCAISASHSLTFRFYPIIRPIMYVLCEVRDFGQSYSERYLMLLEPLSFSVMRSFYALRIIYVSSSLIYWGAVELRLKAALVTRTSAKYCYAPQRCRVSSVNFLIIRSAQSFSCTPT